MRRPPLIPSLLAAVPHVLAYLVLLVLIAALSLVTAIGISNAVGDVAYPAPPVIGQLVEAPALPAVPRSPLLTAVVRCVCSASPTPKTCAAKRTADVAATLATLRPVAAKYKGTLPRYMRLPFLAATACGEGGFRAKPTCGGKPGCNDHGRSLGMFQLGKTIRARLAEPADVYDPAKAADALLSVLADDGVKERAKSACPDLDEDDDDGELWGAIAYRVQRGPWVRRPAPLKIDTDDRGRTLAWSDIRYSPMPSADAADWAVKVWTRHLRVWLPQPGIPRCGYSRYVRMARRWARWQ